MTYDQLAFMIEYALASNTVKYGAVKFDDGTFKGAIATDDETTIFLTPASFDTLADAAEAANTFVEMLRDIADALGREMFVMDYN